MLVSEFDYELPEELIAQRPAPERTASRLLHLDARSGEIEDLAFAELPAQVGGGDTVVLNDTRVIKARLPGRKRTGGRIEVFIERALGAGDALALVRASHAPPEGSELLVGDGVRAIVSGREGELYRLHFLEPIDSVLERFGAVPLPPYIAHPPQAELLRPGRKRLDPLNLRGHRARAGIWRASRARLRPRRARRSR